MFDMISLERQAGCEGATVISDVLNLCDYIRMAYKKLKASVYFDKTQLVLLNKIVNFEAAGVEDALTKLEAKLTGKKEIWNSCESGILSKVGTLVYPKELHDCSKEDEDHGDKEEYVIFNMDNEPIKLERAQYFIDLPVEGHILAVHIAEVAFTCRADTAAVFLLPTTVGVDIAIVIIKIGLADRHPLVQVFEVDTVFLGLTLVFMN